MKQLLSNRTGMVHLPDASPSQAPTWGKREERRGSGEWGHCRWLVDRHWGNAHTQDKALSRNLGRLQGDGESKRTPQGLAELLWYPPGQREMEGRAVCLLLSPWKGLPGMLRPRTITSGKPSVLEVALGEPHSLCSLLSNTPPTPSTSKQSHLWIQMQVAGHTWWSSTARCQAWQTVFTVVKRVCFPQEASSSLGPSGFQCKLQIHLMVY